MTRATEEEIVVWRSLEIRKKTNSRINVVMSLLLWIGIQDSEKAFITAEIKPKIKQ